MTCVSVLHLSQERFCWLQMQKQLQAAQQAAAGAQASLKSHCQQLEEVRQDRDKLQRSIGLRDTALQALRQEVDDVLREDAEKAEGLEEVIEELERLQQSEASKDEQLASSQQHLQVGLLLPSCREKKRKRLHHSALM